MPAQVVVCVWFVVCGSVELPGNVSSHGPGLSLRKLFLFTSHSLWSKPLVYMNLILQVLVLCKFV